MLGWYPTGLRSDGLELTDPYPVGETLFTLDRIGVNGNPATRKFPKRFNVTDNQDFRDTTNENQNLIFEAGLCEASLRYCFCYR